MLILDAPTQPLLHAAFDAILSSGQSGQKLQCVWESDGE